jgi:HEPN domain-containing protein
MESNSLNTDKLIQHWLKSSDEDFETMLAMMESKRYNWALFIGHIVIEKLLKALFVKTNNDYPPLTHNLLLLAKKCNLKMTADNEIFLVTVTAFNINARYDDFKKSFQERCTEEYTLLWIENIKLHRQWIKELITQ